MLTLLSPSKTIDPSPPVLVTELSRPRFLAEANYLARQLKKLKTKDLETLLAVNHDLARLNYERYQLWEEDPDNWEQFPAILSFKGEVFRGLEASTLSDEQLQYAQQHLRILSGLYGCLRPLDCMQPYRLEMGTSLTNRRGKNLYDFWKKDLTRYFRSKLAEQKNPVILNLASREYSQSVDLGKLKVRVVNFNFLDNKDGKYKFLTVYGKNARGRMLRFILDHQIEDPDDLKAFNYNGYIYNPGLSEGDQLVFTRG